MFTTRSLHLLDLENLCASGTAPETLIEKVWQTYRSEVPNSLGDQYILGSSHAFAQRAWFALPAQGIQRCVRSGKDGGELAILEAIDLAQIARRFDRLVIASGDGMFAATAIAARHLGLHVHQVTGLGSPSRQLVAAADSHSRLHLHIGIEVCSPAILKSQAALAA